MNSVYYETIDMMQKRGVDSQYINGWACGFLRTPKREEQRLNEAYETGYAHGLEKNTGGFESWTGK